MDPLVELTRSSKGPVFHFRFHGASGSLARHGEQDSRRCLSMVKGMVFRDGGLGPVDGFRTHPRPVSPKTGLLVVNRLTVPWWIAKNPLVTRPIGIEYGSVWDKNTRHHLAPWPCCSQIDARMADLSSTTQHRFDGPGPSGHWSGPVWSSGRFDLGRFGPRRYANAVWFGRPHESPHPNWRI